MKLNSQSQVYSIYIREIPGWVLLISTLLMMSGLFTGCESSSAELHVAAAASMSDAVKELATAYEKEHPQTVVRLNLAASGTLATQIIKGAPADLFISASSRQARRIIDADLSSRDKLYTLCTNSLVLAVRQDTPLDNAAGMAVLDLPQVRTIGIGEPEYVPAGHYAQLLLQEAKRWQPQQEKLVRGASVRQVLAWLSAGEVDAAFVYATDAALEDNLRVVGRWEHIAGGSIRYPLVPVRGSSSATRRDDFAAFLRSKEAEEILRRYGFSPVIAQQEGLNG